MTRTDVIFITTLPQPNISVSEHTQSVRHVTTSQFPAATEAQTFSIVVVTGILLAALLVLGLGTLAIILLCRRRKANIDPEKRAFPQLPPGMESEFGTIHQSYRDKFDVLFDKRDLQKISRKSKKLKREKDEKCQLCADRDHFVCQGHNLSRSSSFGSKDKKNLNFLVPSGYYEHVIDQTEGTLTDPHVYSQLSEECAAAPKASTAESNHYGHLSLATSGHPSSDHLNLEDEKSDGGYDIPADYYEELPASDIQVAPPKAENVPPENFLTNQYGVIHGNLEKEVLS